MRLSWLAFGAAMLGCGSRPQPPTARTSLRSVIEGELIPSRVLAREPVRGRTLAEARKALGDPAVVVAAWGPDGVLVDETWGAQRDAVVQGASMSKPVACVGAYVLAGRGVLSLDADVNTKLTRWKVPPAPGGKPLTLRHLCTQTSGLAQVSPDLSGGYARGEPLPTIVQMLAGEPPAHLAPLRFEVAPGEREQWSGENWLVLQLLVEDATHRGFADVMREVVLDPLGMKDSAFVQPAGATLIPGHEPDGQPVVGGSRVHPELAAVGLTVSARDNARFLIELQRIAAGRSKLLPAPLQRELGAAIRARQLGLNPDAPDGFIGDGTHAYGYLGVSSAAIDREEGVAVIASCHEEQPGCFELVFDVARTVVHATHLPWTWQPIVPRTLEVRPVDTSAIAGTWRFPAIDVEGQTIPETTCKATPNGATVTWACGRNPERTLYSLGDGRFASLVEAPDLVFSADHVRLVDGETVLRDGERVP